MLITFNLLIFFLYVDVASYYKSRKFEKTDSVKF